jgi:chromosome segregation ATPase
MQYKTLALNLLRQRPRLARQLRRNRTMLATVEQYANQLKDSHEFWKEDLAQVNPENDQVQTTSEALQRALQELEGSLPPEPGRKTKEALSLDAAMAFIRPHTPPV